jgi:cytidylate kinase
VRVIAIDGPGGAGKSTVAREIARRTGLAHLDTGAMYRAVALAALRAGVDASDGERLGALARRLDLRIDSAVCVDGVDVGDALRGTDVSATVSAVAAHPSVRGELVRRQRAWAEAHDGGVIEGRDIGTVVFPEAALKVFLTASDAARAARRSADEGATALARRDRLDSTRAVSPLTPAADALTIDTTDKTVEEVVAMIMEAL